MNQLEIPCFSAVCQITGKTDTVETFGKHMLQKQSDKVGALYCKKFFLAFICIVFITESDICIVYLYDSFVCDRCTEGIAGQISYGIAPSVECFFDEWKPLLLEQPVNKGLKAGIVGMVETGNVKAAVCTELF